MDWSSLQSLEAAEPEEGWPEPLPPPPPPPKRKRKRYRKPRVLRSRDLDKPIHRTQVVNRIPFDDLSDHVTRPVPVGTDCDFCEGTGWVATRVRDCHGQSVTFWPACTRCRG